jgi:hypothetical protein
VAPTVTEKEAPLCACCTCMCKGLGVGVGGGRCFVLEVLEVGLLRRCWRLSGSLWLIPIFFDFLVTSYGPGSREGTEPPHSNMPKPYSNLVAGE